MKAIIETINRTVKFTDADLLTGIAWMIAAAVCAPVWIDSTEATGALLGWVLYSVLLVVRMPT